ncbi:MAG TPA: response regulator [Methylomirabilota bacterium]|nr:response regulator [Methylomirabilota bacterium]
MKTVLIVEDDPRISAALSVRLSAAGYRVLTANDGFAGLKVAVAERPDLILMDVVMPVGLGFSVAERLRDLGLTIPIIFITASRRPGLRRSAERLGAVGFFEKPYDAEELMSAISFVTAHAPPSARPAPRP